MTVKLFKATIDDANIVGPIFDLYRIFYKQESNVEKANQYIRARLEANESIIFFINSKPFIDFVKGIFFPSKS